jgi:hypothetical protein
MLNSLIQHLNCEVCGQELVYDPKATFESYINELEITIENVELEVDKIVGKFLIYECPTCKCYYKYTYKEIEKIIRRETTKQVLLFIARAQMKNIPCIMDGVLIYCGKCSGFDGNGSCTRKIYDKCEVKRFPSGI